MRFWLIKDGEPLPTDEGESRLLRTGLLADYLVKSGHDVTWWTSSFDHFRRSQRTGGPAQLTAGSGVKIQLLPGPGYRRNVSLGRIRHHRRVAGEFLRRAPLLPKADAIVCAMPTIELSAAATKFGRANGIPVVLDLRDLWPDIFVEAFPKPARPFLRPMVWPMRVPLERACRRADALWGITPAFLNWGLKLAGRSAGRFDRYFWHAYPDFGAVAARGGLSDFWRAQGLTASDTIVAFLGSMSLELQPVLEAAHLLADRPNIKLVLCGAGDKLQHYRRSAAGRSNLLLPGWIDRPRILELLRIAHIGLAPYPDRVDFSMSIPNKTVEYMAAGLPVVSSLRGTFEQFLEHNQCGLTYDGCDPRDLATKLRLLADSPQLRETYGQNARKAFQYEFDAGLILSDMRRELEALTDTARATRNGRLNA